MRLLLGGSPCTHWSIAQTKNRETEPSGIGWELFKNYLIAREKYKPDYFLYENNKSMSAAIRAQITKELGVPPVLINSALVSAQNRNRLYWVGKRMPDGSYAPLDIQQPEDRGILLRDILETVTNEKGYILKPAGNPLTEREMEYMMRETRDGRNHFDFDYHHDTTKDKGSCVTANTHRGVPYNVLAECINSNQAKQQCDCIAEPVRIGTIDSDTKHPEHDSQQYRVYSPDGKSVTLCGGGGGIGAKTGLYAVPAGGGYLSTQQLTEKPNACEQHITRTVSETWLETPLIEKPVSPCVSAPAMRVREATKRGYVDILPGECVDLSMPNSKTRRGRSMKNKSNCLTTSCEYYEYCGTLDKPVYQVKAGYITIKDKQYPIKLRDGCYIIRKLTVTECKRLQTVPESYVFPVSDSQAYKMLGNGWTVEVITHILSHIPEITAEPVEVLSMYDGMSCGHLALDRLGAEVAGYFATEIDKYAIQTTQHNYPDTVQLGDAFQVREDGWMMPTDTLALHFEEVEP